MISTWARQQLIITYIQNSFLYTIVPSKPVNSTLSTSHKPFEIKARPEMYLTSLLLIFILAILLVTQISTSVHWLTSKVSGLRSHSLPFISCPSNNKALLAHPFLVVFIKINLPWQNSSRLI